MVAVTAERYDGLSEIPQALEHRAAVVATTGRTGAAVETLTARVQRSALTEARAAAAAGVWIRLHP